MWGILVFVLGILYGWWSPGRQGKLGLFITGVFIGALVAIAFGLLGYFVNANPLGFGTNMLDFVLSFAVMTLVFVVGVWIGDLIEARAPPRSRRAITGRET